MMGKARHYGLHTDSSHRFERGVDAELQSRAIERATQLIVEIAGAVLAQSQKSWLNSIYQSDQQ